MRIVLTLAVLAALMAGEIASSHALGDANLRLLLITAIMLLIVLAARIVSGLTVLQLTAATTDWQQPLRRFTRLRQAHTILWMVCGAAIYGYLRWPTLVQADFGLADAILLDELLLLAPLLTTLALSWAAFYDVELAIHRRIQPSGADAAMPCSRLAFVSAKFRAEFGLLLPPLLVFLLYQDTLRWLFPSAAWACTWVAYLPALATLLVMFPQLLIWNWRATPLADGPLRDQLGRCAEHFSVSLTNILIWPTGGRLTNAAVCGFFGGCRYVLLTDRLVERLAPSEVEAIFAHELAHARRHHLPLRLLALLLPLATVHLIATWLGVSLVDYPVALLAGAVLYWVTFYARYCRTLEHEADLLAALHCSSVAVPPADVPTLAGFERYGNALQHAAGTHRAARYEFASTHPNLQTRLCRLQHWAKEPARCRAFRRRCRVLAAGISAGLFVVVIMAVLL